MTGTGLGLFGVRTRAEGLQGTCGARHNTESSTGTGTVLWFSIPYVPNLDTNNSLYSYSRSPKQTHQLAQHAFEALQISCARSANGGGFQTIRTRNVPSPNVSPRLAQPMQFSLASLSMRAATARATASPPLMLGINPNAAELLIRALKLTAMVVEDTPTVRKLMQKLLLSMGFESVVCYENGSKGLEAMMAGPVDIVFSDVQMPIMTGPEVRYL